MISTRKHIRCPFLEIEGQTSTLRWCSWPYLTLLNVIRWLHHLVLELQAFQRNDIHFLHIKGKGYCSYRVLHTNDRGNIRCVCCTPSSECYSLAEFHLISYFQSMWSRTTVSKETNETLWIQKTRPSHFVHAYWRCSHCQKWHRGWCNDVTF